MTTLLDGALGGPHAVADAGALEGRPGGAGAGEEPLRLPRTTSPLVPMSMPRTASSRAMPEARIMATVSPPTKPAMFGRTWRLALWLISSPASRALASTDSRSTVT